MVQQADDAVVIFGGDGDRGEILGGIAGAGRAVAGEDGAALTAGVGGDGKQDAFIGEKRALLFGEGLALLGGHVEEGSGRPAATTSASTGPAFGENLGDHGVQFFFGVTMAERGGGEGKFL